MYLTDDQQSPYRNPSYETRGAIEKINRINLYAAIALWILGILVFLFNILGLWVPWHLAGFAFFFTFFIPLGISVYTLVKSSKEKDTATRKCYYFRNGIILTVSVVISILTLFVFSYW